VCPPHRWYPVVLAPPEAADELGLPPFTIADLAAERPGDDDGVLLVEGAGGVRSPLAADGDTVDLARAVGVERVVLVAHAGLGTINDVRLATGVLDVAPVTVFLNRWDPADRVCARNAAFLRREGFQVATDVAGLARSVADEVVHADRG
jgi:dethiobiotin synthetase